MQNVQDFPDDPQIIQKVRVEPAQSRAGKSQGLEAVYSSIQSYVSPKSIVTASYKQHYEQEELRAVQQSEHLFDKWVR